MRDDVVSKRFWDRDTKMFGVKLLVVERFEVARTYGRKPLGMVRVRGTVHDEDMLVSIEEDNGTD